MFDNVIVGVDGHEGGEDAIALARQLTAPGASVTPAHVDDAGYGHRSSVAHALHELAESQRCDLLVVGACHLGAVGRMVHGDDTTGVLAGAPCAVAVAPAGYAINQRPLSRLGVGFDGTAEARRALAAARDLAARIGATVEALLVLPLQSRPYGKPAGHRWPDVAAQVPEDDHHRFEDLWDVDSEVRYGMPGEELESFSETVDLLIVGSRLRGPLRRMVAGSTSNHLARRARCPLLVLPVQATDGVDFTTEASLEPHRHSSFIS